MGRPKLHPQLPDGLLGAARGRPAEPAAQGTRINDQRVASALALGYFRLSQGQTPIHTKRSSFVFFCLPRSSLFSAGLCALCASVVNPFCLLPSALTASPASRPSVPCTESTAAAADPAQR